MSRARGIRRLAVIENRGLVGEGAFAKIVSIFLSDTCVGGKYPQVFCLLSL